MKKFLITGGAGFIGSNLVDAITKNGHYAIIIDDLSSGYEKNIKIDSSVKFIKAKVQETNINEILDCDGIFHLAAQASVPYSIQKFFESSKNNMLSSFKVFDWAKFLKIPVIYASSSAIYGNLPIGNDENNDYEILSPYAQDKISLEYYANMCFHVFDVSSIGLRFFNVFGPKQDSTNPYSGVISIFIDKMLNGVPLTLYGGHQTRDFIFVDDVVSVLIESMSYLTQKKTCEIFNVGTGNSVTINHLLSNLRSILSVNPKVIKKPLPEGDPVRSMGTYKKINEVLKIDNSKFIDFYDGLIKTINHYKK